MIIIDSYKYRKYLLDLFPATVAYSLRKLRAGQTRAIRVRRSSDNAEQDIGFVGDETASLLSFCGVGNGFVTTWYDQSGNGYHVTQTTQAKQPQIVSSGAVITENGKPAIQWDGSDALKLPVHIHIPMVDPHSVFAVFKNQSSASSNDSLNQRILGDVEPDVWYEIGVDGGKFGFSQYIDPIRTWVDKTSTLATNNGNVYLGSFIRKAGFNFEIRTNGGNLVSGNIVTDANNKFNTIGNGYPYPQGGYVGSLQEVIIYNTDQTANRTAIESDINTRYSIY